MSLTKTASASGTMRDRLFPLARFSRVPLRVGLEYGMTVQGKPMDVPSVRMPVRSSLAQRLLIHRYQITRNIRLLHGYGFAPGNPVLKADSTPLTAKIKQNTPTPTMTRFGMSPVQGVRVFPRTALAGGLGSPKRFPKAIPVIQNTYTPPVYGAEGA